MSRTATTVDLFQFICVFNDAETFVSWERNKTAARDECFRRLQRNPRWVLKTGKRMKVNIELHEAIHLMRPDPALRP